MLTRTRHLFGGLASRPRLRWAMPRRPIPTRRQALEYQLPLDRAREETGSGTERPRDSGGAQRPTPVPLFGAGVEADETGCSSRPKTHEQRSGHHGLDRARRRHELEKARAQAPGPDHGRGGGPVAICGGSAGVLLLGRLAGSGFGGMLPAETRFRRV